MDSKLYLELRTMVRNGVEQESRNQDFLINFIRLLEHRVNQSSGVEKKVCKAGSLNASTFVPGEYDCFRSTVGFSLQFEFHNSKNEVIYIARVPFISKCDEVSFSVRCIPTNEEVEQVRALAVQPEGQLAVANMLDRALTEAVEKFLHG